MNSLGKYTAKLLIRCALPIMEKYARYTGVSALLDFGPIPLHSNRFPSLPFLATPKQKLSVREKFCAVSCFCTVFLSSEACSELIQSMRLHASCAIFLDIKEPERNLEYPAFFVSAPLRIAMGTRRHHNELEALFYKEGLRPHARHTLFAGILSLMALHFDSLP